MSKQDLVVKLIINELLVQLGEKTGDKLNLLHTLCAFNGLLIAAMAHTTRAELEKRGMFTEARFDAAKDYIISSLDVLAHSDDFPTELASLRAEMNQAKEWLLALQAA